MTGEGGAPAILVGTLVRVARPVGGGPVNREGHTGRVIDIAGDRHGREALIDYGRGHERWVPLRYLVPASAIFEDNLDVEPTEAEYRATFPEPEHYPPMGREERAAIIAHVEGELAHVAEPEGHDEHLDAIEDAIAKARRTPTYDVALSMRHLGELGVIVTGRALVAAASVAFIPKGVGA